MKILYRFLFLAVFLGIVPLSCERCNSSACECDDFGPVADFEITDMGIRTVTVTGHTDVDTSEHYPVRDLAIAISITDQQNVAYEAQSSDFSFANAAFACSPVEPRSVQFIQNIEVTAANEVIYKSQQDVIHAGDMITDRFNFDLYSSHASDSLNVFLEKDPALSGYGSFYLQLNSAPFQPTTLKVNVAVTLSDGQVFTFENEVLKIK